MPKPTKPLVSVLKTSPQTVLADYSKLMHLAEYQKSIHKAQETVLKLNLSWSLYYPSCSTEPWQLEGVLKTLQKDGYKNLHPVENRTVVTDVWKGAKGNKWLPILDKYNLKYEPLTEVEWVNYKPKAEMLAMDKIFPGSAEGHKIPKMFIGKNVIHLPTVKCVHPDTEIFLADGSLISIKEMVEEVHKEKEVKFTEDGDAVASSNHDLPTFSSSGRIVQDKAVQFWRTPAPKQVFKIKTKTGREVKVSEEHPFLTEKGWKKAKDLEAGARVAIPRKINVCGKPQLLPKISQLNYEKIDLSKIIFKPGKKHSCDIQKAIIKDYLKGKTTTQLAKEKKLNPETIREILLRYNIPVRWVRSWANPPEKTSPEFWKWMGYFIAEGYAKECNGSMRFWWGTNDQRLNNEYAQLTKHLFGIDVKIKKSNRDVVCYYFDCNNLILFFEKIGLTFPMVAGTKKVPLLLFKCTDAEIAAFLQGYLEGDGTVGKDGLHATSKSKSLIEKIQLLLLRLGIVSFINSSQQIATNGKMKNKETYWNIGVYGEELVNFSKHLNFISEYKQKNLEALVNKRKKSKNPSNWDTIPIDSKIFRKVREGLGFTQHSSGKASSVNGIENKYCLPTRPIITYFIKLFEDKDVEHTFESEINYFKSLSSEDIAWDYVESIAPENFNNNFLYDITVPTTNNFIGNGILLHNTHGHTQMTGAMKNAFGGLITRRRHHCHKMIHEVLVDLLAIQKEIHPGIFAVMDGTVAGDGAGPRTMIPKIKNYLLASGDQVAIDAISAKMMGYEPLKIKFIKLAHDRGLGMGDPRQIEVVGEDISKINFHFQTSRSPVILGDKLFRFGALRFVEPLLFHTPLFKLCVFGSEFYHDRLWYNTVGKRHINKFMQTEWGKLWQKY